MRKLLIIILLTSICGVAEAGTNAIKTNPITGLADLAVGKDLSIRGELTSTIVTADTIFVDIAGTSTNLETYLDDNITNSGWVLSASGVTLDSGLVSADLGTASSLTATNAWLDVIQSGGTFDADGDLLADGDLIIGDDVTITDQLIVNGTSYEPYDAGSNLSNTGADTVNFTADSLVVQGISLIDVDLTATITTNNAENGLDAGDSQANQTWYEIYVICKNNGDSALALNEYLTTSGSTSITKPSGYTLARHVGFVLNDNAGNFDKISNSIISYNGEVNARDFVSNSNVLTFDGTKNELDISGYVPPDAGVAHIKLEIDDNTPDTELELDNKQGGKIGAVIAQVDGITNAAYANCPLYGGNARKIIYEAPAGTDTGILGFVGWFIGGGDDQANVGTGW